VKVTGGGSGHDGGRGSDSISDWYFVMDGQRSK